MAERSGTVLYEQKGGIGVLSVDRPEALNALSKPIIDEMEEILDRIAGDGVLRVLVVGGTKNFAAGADIKGMVECDEEEAKAFAFNSCYNKLMNFRVPTIAAVSGYALGGGLELALCCDMRIASDTAQMGLPETNLGIMPGAGGTVRLPRLVGYAKACEMIFMGKQVKAEEAERIGLVNLVVPEEELMAETMKWAEKLARRAPIAIATAKRTMRKGLSLPSVEAAVAYEAEEWAGLFRTEDQKEGMRAFIEKRKPAYRGK